MNYASAVENGKAIDTAPTAPNAPPASSCKPVFFLEKDVHAVSPSETFFTNVEVYKAVARRVQASNIAGIQQVRGLWRLYLRDPEERASLIASGISLRDRYTTPNDNIMPAQYKTTSGTQTQNGCPFTGSTNTAPRRALRLTDHLKDTHLTDTLHLKATNVSPCSSGKCMGSVVQQRQPFPPDYKRPKDEVLEQAKEFIDDYYASLKKANSDEHEKRWLDIQAQVSETGLYDLQYDELLYGAKMAWRNAPRCIGRYQWNNLQVIDYRNVKTAKEMFDAVCDHVRYATKDGQMKTAISIFPMRTDGKHDWKFWNKLLFQYAGYEQPDGSVIGDPGSLELTKVCQSLGWKGKGTPYDFLPAIVSANGEDPVVFDWPEDVPLELELRHPKHDWFEELAIKVNCIPMQGDMLFDVGGMQFPACPITGWFQSTEPVRDLLDENRYNMTEMIAKKLGYDTSRYNSLWKDAAFLEVHIAVLHTFQMNGVMTQDPHTLTESFMKHMEREHRLRGGCPSDWVWIVPPSCSSLTPVFHQEMLNYHLRPALEYQAAGWTIHTWKTPPTAPVFTQYIRTKERCSFKAAAMAVMFAAGLMRKTLNRRVKSTILFASQTGKAETFSHSLCDLYKHAFHAKVVCMDEYDVTQLDKEQLVIVVTSTFGNGDPPDNGKTFARALMQMKNQKDQTSPNDGPLSSVRFAVFALGSRAYPHFCGFGHSVDTLLDQLGAQRIHAVGEGDELCGQEESFRTWAESAFKSACLSYDVGHGVDMNEATANLLGSDLSWAPDKFRLVQAKSNKDTDLLEGLSTVHRKNVVPCTFISRTQLQAPDSSRQTILVQLDTKGSEELKFSPGDHLGIFPANENHLVQRILGRIDGGTNPDDVLEIEALHKKTVAAVVTKTWMPFERLPPCSLRTALSRYLDITTPPSPQLLGSLAMHTNDTAERAGLQELAKGGTKYEDWKFEHAPTLPEVLQEFPSLTLPPALLLSQLPVLQQRYYSISSSPHMYPGQIHATLAVVSYRTQGGKGPTHNGVCSSWLNRIEEGETVPCFVRTAKNFHLPDNPSVPVLMVGPGTGIAPLRSFWQQRQADIKSGDRHHGDMTLVFGCRQSQTDHIYREETAQAQTDGALTDIYTAYSREPGRPKTYVQHILYNQLSQRVQELLDSDGHIYVCGDVAMADDVCTTVQKILEENSAMTSTESEAFIRNLKDSNRYHEDIFGVTLNTKAVREAARSIEPAKSTANGHNIGNGQ